MVSNYTAWNTYPTKIPNFQALNQRFEQLIIFSLITSHGTPIQWKYPIFTPLSKFFSNYTPMEHLSNRNTQILLFLIQNGRGSTAIALRTATSSSEFKRCIQPIMDGHAPTMVNIWRGSIVLLHMSPWFYMKWAHLLHLSHLSHIWAWGPQKGSHMADHASIHASRSTQL